MCLLESYAAGSAARVPIDEAIVVWERAMAEHLDESPEHASMPSEMITVFAGASLEIARDRLQKGREGELPELIGEAAEVLLSYRPPPQPLRMATRPPKSSPETIEGTDHRERALRALADLAAERGYENVGVNEVVKRASMSPATFYANFSGKEDALIAAIESAGAQVVAATLPAFRRHADWPQGVRAAIGSLLNFLASRPALARLLTVEVYAAGPRALEARDDALRALDVILAPGERSFPEVASAAPWVIAEGAYALGYRKVSESGATSLPSLAPILTYLALAPFIGADAACEAANGAGQGRRSQSAILESTWKVARSERLKRQVLANVASAGEASVTSIADDLDAPIDLVGAHVEELREEQLIEPIEGAGRGSEQLYRSNLTVLEEEQWSRLSRVQRERISEQIAYLIASEIELAVSTRTFDRRTDRHLTRLETQVDEPGWEKLRQIHDDALRATMRVHRECVERLKASGETGVSVRSLQTLFERPDL
jgi:AcrR family transcriptional regulator